MTENVLDKLRQSPPKEGDSPPKPQPTKEELLLAIQEAVKIAEEINPKDDQIIQCLGKLLGAQLKLTQEPPAPPSSNPFRRRR